MNAHSALAATRPALVPLAPEITVLRAARSVGLWDLAGGYRSDEPPPFWAFPWPGGQALARYVLDDPAVVAGRRVLDLAAGSGLVAIAAARAGAAAVLAVDVDPAAVAAVAANARLNGVTVRTSTDDLLAGTGERDTAPVAEVVLVGDAFYSAGIAGRMLAFLRRQGRAGARVLVGDPDRGHLPHRFFRPLVAYEVPVPRVLEDEAVRRTTVWELIPDGPGR